VHLIVQVSPGIVLQQSVTSTWLALRSGTVQLPGVGVVVAVVVVLVSVEVIVVVEVAVAVVVAMQTGEVPTSSAPSE
jgi:hypothetical protein